MTVQERLKRSSTWRWIQEASQVNTADLQYTTYSPIINIFFCITRGGYVLIWHSYVPSSSRTTDSILSFQLFGYWNSILYRLSPLYVWLPTVSNSSPLSPGFRRTHDTCKCCVFCGNQIERERKRKKSKLFFFVISSIVAYYERKEKNIVSKYWIWARWIELIPNQV